MGNVVDPLGGAYYIEDLTDKIEKEVEEYLKKIEELGGAIKAVETGYIQKEIQEAAYQYHQSVESKERIVVGVNQYIDKTEEKLKIYRASSQLEERQIENLRKLRSSRDNAKVKESLDQLLKAANGRDNLMPFICLAVERYATVGEISTTLRQSFGQFRPIATL